MNKPSDYKVRRTVKRKWVEVKEIAGAGSYELEPHQRIIDCRIVHEVVEIAPPTAPRLSWHTETAMPEVKTILALECVEFEYE